MFRSCLSIFLIISGVLSADSTKFRCDRLSDDYKCRLSSITPYRYIANYNDEEIKFKDCEPKKIWMMIRHGTRKPGKKVLSTLGELEKIREAVINKCDSGPCDLTVDLLKRVRDWEHKLKPEDEMILAGEGEDELIGLAERFQARFPTLMPEKFDNKTYKFKFTQKQRTEESARYFAIGLFGKKGSKHVWYPPSEESDPILRFYKACGKWQQQVKRNPEAYEEQAKFKKSDVAKKMVEDVSNRVGKNISFDDVKLMAEICAFETAWNHNNNSPWCDLLTPEEFQIVEFAKDLKYFWIDGYGFPLTAQHACTALKDMFEFFDLDSDATTTAYFSHSGTLLKILSLLEVSKDNEPMRHHQFPSDDRLWRTSFIDSFATNVAFISFDCKNTGRNILVMHQERVINLPGCPEGLPCPLSTMKDKYPDNDDECPFLEMCRTDTRK
ncbi:multiple inositol polyphosphate phosphatase 1 [Fopius arisanus]|uniref:Multiple inositol polyphosphate phosphatase 1 n=1 Tax=Fopius arisanus TaxID=64838 RepID=A0A0C9QVI9_9HYME|nr:PREDICTED: multiple inositol polyphosphate phosphatase 1 [Fopius arisanus]